MTTKEDFTKRYNAVKEDVINAMDMALERAIGNNALDLDALQGNFADIYPLLAAVLQRETAHMLEGSSYESVRRAQKRQATKYRQDYRIWCDYAGDYKGNGE